MKILVGIPAYNEERYISGVVLLARQYADEVVVVDDGSTDRTAEFARLAGATVIVSEGNLGYGATIQAIFNQAAERLPDVLITLDGDGQHDCNDIPKFVAAIEEGADVVIGSRALQRHRIPPYRRLGQKILARLTNLASRTNLSDTESGFRAYSRKAMRGLKLTQRGMAVSAEIITRASALGLAIDEVPISISYNGDSSTLNPVSHGLGVLTEVIFMVTDRRPLLIFGIGGLICFILGLVFGIQAIVLYQTSGQVGVGHSFLTALFLIVSVLLLSTGAILSAVARRERPR